MASLKEVKTRISSVNSTRKITSAMKMVASSKLHRAQQSIESMRPYQEKLQHITSTFVSNLDGQIDTPYAEQREKKRVAIVLYTSNSSLCGAFNANAIRAFTTKCEQLRQAGAEVTQVYPIGKKAADAVRKSGFPIVTDYSNLLDHPSYAPAAKLAQHLMDEFASSALDEVILIYHHFHSVSRQQLVEETFLPVQLEEKTTHQGDGDSKYNNNYIIEPSVESLLDNLIPRSLHLKLYTALLDSLASEHAARIIAMQVATDNADELLRQLTLTYNKTRQQAITNELLDIVGGSML